MPYIKKEDRGQYNTYINSISNIVARLKPAAKSGHLNYVITKLLLRTIPARYNDYNTIVGILECVKLELYRRRIATHEDIKIEENGDV